MHDLFGGSKMDMNYLIREYQGLVHANRQVFLSFKPVEPKSSNISRDVNVNIVWNAMQKIAET